MWRGLISASKKISSPQYERSYVGNKRENSNIESWHVIWWHLGVRGDQLKASGVSASKNGGSSAGVM